MGVVVVKISAPKNRLGYVLSELQVIMSEKELSYFEEWMRGQTVGVDQETNEIYYYIYDVHRFLAMSRGGIPTIWD